MVFNRKFCEKRQIWVSEPNFGEVSGDARPWFMAPRKVHIDFIIASIKLFFAICYGFVVYKAKFVQLGCLQSWQPLCTQILSGQGCRPSTILGIRELEALGYPMVNTAFSCVLSFLTKYWSVTDGRISHVVYSAYKANFARCENIAESFKPWVGRTNVTDADTTDGFAIAKTQT